LAGNAFGSITCQRNHGEVRRSWLVVLAEGRSPQKTPFAAPMVAYPAATT
jgi:hypothetical protein